jgi:hypothetical protein
MLLLLLWKNVDPNGSKKEAGDAALILMKRSYSLSVNSLALHNVCIESAVDYGMMVYTQHCYA